MFVLFRPVYAVQSTWGSMCGGQRPTTCAGAVTRPVARILSLCVVAAVAQLLEAAGPAARVCRVMPNTPCLVGETAAAMCLGGKVRHCSVFTCFSTVAGTDVEITTNSFAHAHAVRARVNGVLAAAFVPG